MQISELALRVLLLFFPGLVCTWIVGALTVHKKWAPFDVLLRSFVFGITSYGIYWALCQGCFVTWGPHVIGLPPHEFAFSKALLDSKVALSFGEIAIVTVISMSLALAFSAFATHKMGHRFARKINCTKKSGELDVWGWAMNSDEIQFATIRNHEFDLVYDGWIKSFSDDGETRELLLNDVSVYRNSDGEPLYSIGAMYICLDEKNFTVEFRDVPYSEGFQPITVPNYEQTTSESTERPTP